MKFVSDGNENHAKVRFINGEHNVELDETYYRFRWIYWTN